MPAPVLPKMRLFPNDVVVPVIPVVLNEISELEIDIVPPFCSPVAFPETRELSRPTCEPASPSTPAEVLPEKTERVMLTLLPVAVATPKPLLIE